MFKFISAVVSAIAMVGTVEAAGGSFEYKNMQNWHTLNSDNGACTPGSSTKQSPIDLVDAVNGSYDMKIAPKFNTYPNMVNAKLERSKNGLKADIKYDSGSDQKSVLELENDAGDEMKYHVVQVHLHNPSEHKVAGMLYDLEMHFVHIKPLKTQLNEGLAVLGVFFDRKAGGNFDN